MTDRARRLGRYLENNLGWEIQDNRAECGCGVVSYGAKFCRECGKKLPKPPKKKETYESLELAISYALNE